MDIVNAISKEIDKFNDEARCGLCWVFVPSGRSDYFNTVKLRDGSECCVYVAMLDLQLRSGYEVRNDFVTKRYCDWTVQLFAGIPSRLDLQYYNENPDHPASEGKYEKYIKHIFDCFGCSCFELDLCEIENCKGDTTVEVTSWQLRQRLNYQDLNLDGALITGTFREWIN